MCEILINRAHAAFKFKPTNDREYIKITFETQEDAIEFANANRVIKLYGNKIVHTSKNKNEKKKKTQNDQHIISTYLIDVAKINKKKKRL